MQDEQKRNPGEFKITSNWGNSSKELREKHPTLTEQDVKFETGKENELLGRMEKKLGKNRDEVISIIQEVQPKS
ncbi:MAG TPA: hypothetical protein VL093_08730 [Flavipsychrobacter sp.]|nr:hypothetical protein [Flavipsychrobacter sp.]